MEEIFKYKSLNIDKLFNYGFIERGDNFEYKTNLLDGEFVLIVYATKNGEIKTKVFDNKLAEEYVLYHLKTAVGEFVGKIREAANEVLQDICDKCFENKPFKGRQTNEIIDYIKNKYNGELEFLWENFPTDAIWRRKDNRKWYGLLMAISKRKLGIDSDEIVEVIDLRLQPEEIDTVINNKNIFLAYHMNKKHWFTICLDGSVALEKIIEFIDKSYILAKK